MNGYQSAQNEVLVFILLALIFFFIQKTKKFYVGSGYLYQRKHRHYLDLKNNRHDNWRLQEAYNTDPELIFYVLKITQTASEAFDLEQSLLNHWFDTGILFNLARDARCSGNGRVVSDAEKERLRQLKKGIPRPEYVKAKIRAARQQQLNSKEAMERMRIGNLKRSKQVIIDGIEYDSMRDAARCFNIDKSTVADRINSLKFPTWKFKK